MKQETESSLPEQLLSELSINSRKEQIELETLEVEGIEFLDYKDESQLNDIMRLVGRDLSEPYSSKFCQDRV